MSIQNILLQKIVFQHKKDIYINAFCNNFVGIVQMYIQSIPTMPSTGSHNFPCWYVNGVVNSDKVQLLLYNVAGFANDTFSVTEIKKIIGHPRDVSDDIPDDVRMHINSIYRQHTNNWLFKKDYSK